MTDNPQWTPLDGKGSPTEYLVVGNCAIQVTDPFVNDWPMPNDPPEPWRISIWTVEHDTDFGSEPETLIRRDRVLCENREQARNAAMALLRNWLAPTLLELESGFSQPAEEKLEEVSEHYRSLYGAILRYAYPPEGKILECLLCGGRGMGGASVQHTPECPTKGPREPGSTIGYLEKRLNGE